MLLIPSESQVGTHTVNVSLNDGYETIYDEFEIEVTEQEIISEPDEKGSPIILIIFIILFILILIGVGVGVFFYLKKQNGLEKTEENEVPQNENIEDTQNSDQKYLNSYGPY